MPSYMVIYKQSGGCDYTIGCGLKTVSFTAESFVSAKSMVEKALLGDTVDDYSGTDPQGLLPIGYCEGGIDSARVFEVTLADHVDMRAIQHQLELAEQAAEIAATETKERQELERLQRKFAK